MSSRYEMNRRKRQARRTPPSPSGKSLNASAGAAISRNKTKHDSFNELVRRMEEVIEEKFGNLAK